MCLIAVTSMSISKIPITQITNAYKSPIATPTAILSIWSNKSGMGDNDTKKKKEKEKLPQDKNTMTPSKSYRYS